MIDKIKSWVPHSFKKIVSYSYPFNRSNQYTYFQPNFDQLNVSDFFLFRCDNFDTVFIAENNLAIFTSDPVECKHVFYFFSISGSNCGRFEVNSDSFHYQLKIDSEMTGGETIGGFIHQTAYPNEFLEKIPVIDSKQLIFQHRGYTGFRRKESSSSCFSFLHGNFGGMYIHKGKLHSMSRQRSEHFYTPQIIIKNDKFYELFFLNPTSKMLIISIFLIDKFNQTRTIGNSKISPFGSYKFELNTFSESEIQNISWKTNLPIGRAIVFENNDVLFDVFHS